MNLPTDLCAPTATTEVAALRHWRANCRHEASSRPRPRRGLLMVTLLLMVMLGRYWGRLHPSHVTVGLGPVTTRHRGAAGDPMFTPRGSAEDCAPGPAPCVTLTGTGPPPPVSQLSHSGHRILEINGSRHPHTGQQQHHQSPPAKGKAELSYVNV